MTEYIQMLRERFIITKEHKQYRQEPWARYEMAEEWSKQGYSDAQRATERLKAVLRAEKPQVWQDEKIALIRTVPVLPELFTEEEWKKISDKFYIHEQGKVCNLTPDYESVLNTGFDAQRETVLEKKNALPKEAVEERAFLDSLLHTMQELEAFADRYREAALAAGNTTVASSFEVIPRKKPETFLQALQFLRLLHYGLWTSFNYHNTFGRLDQYLYPFYEADVKAGRLTQEEALELVEEFFISCNKDSDLYPGMQQGDNGQSVVLGGYSADGEDQYNALSEMCMCACEELCLIDPKINLRVSSKTPLERYVRGSRLTKLGLGFPQYSNDDIVIPCLERWGYQKEDAYNYTIAACWEFIIPGYGMDIPNINALSFARVILEAMPALPDCTTFEDFLMEVKKCIFKQTESMIEQIGEIYMEAAPLMSLLMKDCIDNCKDISKGNRYNNFGFHGSGLSTAVDSLAAIQKYVFEEKRFTAQKMIDMLACDFEGYEIENNLLRYEAPKMGNDDDNVNEIAKKLLDWFADAVEGHKNSRGGIYRAGTGSAMYYVWYGKEEGATPDGRRKGEELACNYSPSLFSRCNGPVSIMKAFSKPDLKRVANGGPLTIELSDTVFRNDDSIQKVGMLVKSFIDMGGHQIQINSVNADILKDAKLHPEKHRNLIVRVWGWSGYFVELDEVYQNHIMKRMELSF